MNLEGKIISFLGDSITEGEPGKLENRYDNILKRECGLKAAYNYGVGGTRIAHQSIASEIPRYDLSFCARACDLHPDSDIIIVYGGTNDYGHGNALFGTMEDKTPNTFCGAVDFLMSCLLREYPGARIVFLTPTRRLGDTEPSTNPNKFSACKNGEESLFAKPLKAYVDVIVEMGKRHGVEVYNLYEEIPIDPNNEEDREKYTRDGLHLNDAGYRILADYLKNVL